MKKIPKHFLIVTLLLLAILACTKEITDDLILSFNAEFSETTLNSFLNTPKDIEFKITDGPDVPESFSIKYNINEGSGSYLLNNQLIEEDQFIVLSDLTNTISYTGTTVGINKVRVVIRDQYQNEKEFILTYDVKDTAFDIEITPAPSSAYIGGTIDLNFEINNEISPADYTIFYRFMNIGVDGAGTGIIYKEGEVLDQEELVAIDQGNTFIWQLEGTTVGDLTIEFIVESSLNATIEKSIVIPVTETPDFTFIVETASSELATNSEATFNFKITEIVGSSDYKMIYNTSNSGVLKLNEVEYQAGDEIAVGAGEFSGFYTGTTMGTHEVVFNVVNANSTPVEKMGSLMLTYTDPDTEAPVIELIGAAEITIRVGEEFNDPGATATDNVDTSIEVVVTGSVDINIPDEYILTYTATDSSDNTVSITRKVIVIDDEAPVITLLGDNPLTILIGTTFTDPGVTLSDNVDTTAMLQGNLTITDNVNVNLEGDYTVTYSVTDSSNNTTSLNRRVIVIDDEAPVITINGDNPLVMNGSPVYEDPGATAVDTEDGILTDDIVVTNTVQSEVLGSYTVIYEVKDSADNRVTARRDVTIIDTERPVIILNGNATVTVNQGGTYVEEGALVSDNINEVLTDDVVITGNVDTTRPDTYILTYNVSDASGNAALPVTRTVIVQDAVAPVITLVGAANITIEAGTNYVDQGASAMDNIDGDISSSIITTGSVNTNVPGTYTLRYNVSDQAGNSATEVTRQIVVRDTIIPIITLRGASEITIDEGTNYNDQGATASDNIDGNISSSIVVTGGVNTNIPGSYTIRYNVTDASGNAAIEVRRRVIVNNVVITPSFNASTGILVGEPGAAVSITINGGGFQTDFSSSLVGRANTPSGNQLIDLNINQIDPILTGNFIMPSMGIVYFVGSHSDNGSGNSGSTFIITVAGQALPGVSMSSGAGGGIPR